MDTRNWIDKTETFTNVRMELVSIGIWKNVQGELKAWKGLFEVGPDAKYSQLFWLDKHPTADKLAGLLGKVVTADILLNERGFQYIANLKQSPAQHPQYAGDMPMLTTPEPEMPEYSEPDEIPEDDSVPF